MNNYIITFDLLFFNSIPHEAELQSVRVWEKGTILKAKSDHANLIYV